MYLKPSSISTLKLNKTSPERPKKNLKLLFVPLLEYLSKYFSNIDNHISIHGGRNANYFRLDLPLQYINEY